MKALAEIYKEVNKDRFLEGYTANLAAQLTEIMLGNKTVRN